MGDGVALPHVKMADLKEQLIVFGRSKAGIPFAAADGRPVQLFFLLVAPPEQATLHLRTLASLSRMLRDKELRQQLLAAEGADGAELTGLGHDVLIGARELECLEKVGADVTLIIKIELFTFGFRH